VLAVDANQFVYWLKGITDTTPVPGPDTWAKIARRIDEVLAASNQKPAPPNYPVMRGAGGLEDFAKQVDEINKRVAKQYGAAAPIKYPDVISGVQKND
jgi:hypothetical protein